MSLEEVARERRRSPRVLRVLPLALHAGDRVLEVRSLEINAHGAIVSSRESLRLGLAVLVDNPSTRKRASGWTVRCAAGEEPGSFETAIEFLEPAPGFWGADYAP